MYSLRHAAGHVWIIQGTCGTSEASRIPGFCVGVDRFCGFVAPWIVFVSKKPVITTENRMVLSVVQVASQIFRTVQSTVTMADNDHKRRCEMRIRTGVIQPGSPPRGGLR